MNKVSLLIYQLTWHYQVLVTIQCEQNASTSTGQCLQVQFKRLPDTNVPFDNHSFNFILKQGKSKSEDEMEMRMYLNGSCPKSQLFQKKNL